MSDFTFYAQRESEKDQFVFRIFVSESGRKAIEHAASAIGEAGKNKEAAIAISEVVIGDIVSKLPEELYSSNGLLIDMEGKDGMGFTVGILKSILESSCGDDGKIVFDVVICGVEERNSASGFLIERFINAPKRMRDVQEKTDENEQE